MTKTTESVVATVAKVSLRFQRISVVEEPAGSALQDVLVPPFEQTF